MRKRKIVGGICAGLAYYFNIDSVWPRLIFALLTLGTYGGFLIVYAILWIAIPASAELEEEAAVKKMYRNPENKVVGGVASGVAAYFGIRLHHHPCGLRRINICRVPGECYSISSYGLHYPRQRPSPRKWKCRANRLHFPTLNRPLKKE